MAAFQATSDAQLQQLGEARNLVLKDPGYWPQVLQGTLPLITSGAIEVRRWGADFLAETFSTPVVDARAKQELALACLDTLLRLSNETETGILKSVVQCSASVYPIVFRHICSNRNDADTWNKMVAIKSKILSLWDVAPIGVRICCIKFVQRVILVQSRGVTDPRLVDRSETSLATVPANHPLLSLPSLDAEAQGLLDRLLSILHEEHSEPTLITATLNNLAPLVKTRPPLAQRIIGAVLAFNPFARMPGTISVQDRLVMISVEKTVRVMLLNIMRNNQQTPFAGRISQHIQRLAQAKAELNDSFSRKRSATSQQDADSKRQKVDRISTTPRATPPPPAPLIDPLQGMQPGPVTFAKLFTLATDPALTSFDGQQLPLDLVLQIVIGSIYNVDQAKLDAAIAMVKARYEAVMANPPARAPGALPLAPSAPQPQTAEAGPPEPPNGMALVKAEAGGEGDEDVVQLQLGEYKLPPPVSLNTQQAQLASLNAMERMFSVIDDFEKTSLISRKSKLGVRRLAASSWDREGWISVLVRTATRGAQDAGVKSESGQAESLPDILRERLYQYIIADFRQRMDIAVAWLNEEWYNDKTRSSSGTPRQPQYQKWMMKVMDAIIPFLEVRDRLFMRTLSELPEIPVELLHKVKLLCLDPDRSSLGIQMLQYLAMFRPPVREQCVDVLEDLWRNHAEVRGQVQKLVAKFRPAVLTPAIEAGPGAGSVVVNGGANVSVTPNA